MKNFTFPLAPLAFTLLLVNGVNAQTLSQESFVLGQETISPKSSVRTTETQAIASFSKHPKEPDILQVDSPKKGRVLIVDSTGKKWQEQAITIGSNYVQLGQLRSGSYVIKLKDEQGKMLRMMALNYVKIE